MKLFSKLFTISACLLLLSACGFHLRGTAAVPPEFHSIYVTSGDAYSSLRRDLANTLRSMRVTVPQHHNAANLHIEILDNITEQSFTSVSANTNTRQFSLTQTVHFRLVYMEHPVSGTIAVSALRTITTNANTLLASSYEVTTLKDEMQREIIIKIINHLQSRRTLSAIHKIKQQHKSHQHAK